MKQRLDAAVHASLFAGNLACIALQELADKRAGDPEFANVLHLLAIHTARTNDFVELLMMRVEEAESPSTAPTPPHHIRAIRAPIREAEPEASTWERVISWLG